MSTSENNLNYTDPHDVDEDKMTIFSQGGFWGDSNQAGVMKHDLYRSSVYYDHEVASKCRHWKMIKYYTDWHDVDEDGMTILIHGGAWYQTLSGISRRHISISPTTSGLDVASSDI